MKIKQLNIYPVKSLRGISLPTASLCAQGLEYDRRYILLKPLSEDGTYENMFVGDKPEMALFHCAWSSPTTFSVSYHAPSPAVTPPHPTQQRPLDIPFEPDATDLQEVHITLHKDPNYPAFVMPHKYNTWFSDCFGYKVVLAYLGDGLGVQMHNEKTQNWLTRMKPILRSPTNSINFSDGAALLVTSEASVTALHPRLEDGQKVVHEKFRPNIVIDGAAKPWDEDFWGELQIVESGLKLVLTSNCARCVSINIDLDKGNKGEGESGKLLKKMMLDRRIDPGHKWTPIFGRYGFPTSAGKLSVGDEVIVSRRNAEHTEWDGIMPRLANFDGAPTASKRSSKLADRPAYRSIMQIASVGTPAAFYAAIFLFVSVVLSLVLSPSLLTLFSSLVPLIDRVSGEQT